jgi:hypothetical protein
MRKALALRWLALLALPLVLGGALPAQALLRCALDGNVRTHCCCPPPAQSEDARMAAADACCCSVTRNDAAPQPISAARTAAADASAATAAFVPTTLPAPRSARHGVRPARSSTQPALGPPIVLLKQSLLI